MYIRANKTFNKKTQTEYITHRLVESYKTEDGPRQRVIMHLGTLDLPKSQWRHLASILEARLAGQYSLTEDNQELSCLASQLIKRHEFMATHQQEKQERRKEANIVGIDLNSVQTTLNRTLGPELVADAFWKKLGFEQILAGLDFDEKGIALAKAVILGRLLAPGSEYSTWEWFQKRSSLAEFMAKDIRNLGKDSFYVIGDLIYEHKLKIEQALQSKEKELYSLTRAVVLFDLTNTFFEGSALGNSLAKRGKCKSNRTDCPLVTLALAVDSLGFPLFSQIYGGNQSEPETLETVLKRLFPDGNPLFAEYLPTIIMDRGIATKDNIALIKKKYGLPYTVIERRAMEKEYVAEFETARDTFERITAPEEEKQKSDTEAIYIKNLAQEETSRILVFSEGRKQKETAIDTTKEKRFLEELTKLNNSVKKGTIRQKDKVAERVGKIKAKYPTVQRYYTIDILCDEKDQAIELSFAKNPMRDERAVLTGCYVIETTHTEQTAAETWHQYMLLSHVEAAFRDMKSDLGLRPVYHQKAEKTEAHLFIAVLAYHILVSIEHELRAQGDHREWRTIRKLLSSHNRSTVIMTGEDETIYHIRVSGTPESEQSAIYKKLSIKDPLKRSIVIKGSRK
jgi:transposase